MTGFYTKLPTPCSSYPSPGGRGTLPAPPVPALEGETLLRHVVLLRFAPDATDEAVRALRDGLAELPAAIPQIERYAFGPDLHIAEGNFDFALVADFADRAAYETYAAHARHRQLIAERIRPILAERVAVQYEI